MKPVSNLIRVSLPNYLSSLPIPDTFGGWFHLGVRDWLSLVPLGAAIAGMTFITYKAFCPAARRDSSKDGHINKKVKKDIDKVVDSFDLEDIGDKASFCRCWRSKNFPYCDGSHAAHNKATGDNVGPVCLQHKLK